jgi:hypothetical protein
LIFSRAFFRGHLNREFATAHNLSPRSNFKTGIDPDRAGW